MGFIIPSSCQGIPIAMIGILKIRDINRSYLKNTAYLVKNSAQAHMAPQHPEKRGHSLRLMRITCCYSPFWCNSLFPYSYSRSPAFSCAAHLIFQNSACMRCRQLPHGRLPGQFPGPFLLSAPPGPCHPHQNPRPDLLSENTLPSTSSHPVKPARRRWTTARPLRYHACAYRDWTSPSASALNTPPPKEAAAPVSASSIPSLPANSLQ